MEKATVNELNTLLKGEQIAIDAYNSYIDVASRSELVWIRQDHERHAGELRKRIRALGGEPEQNTGFVGFMAGTRLAVQNIGGRDTVSILKKAYDGVDKGIAMAEEIIKGDLDNESMVMVEKMLTEDHGHLRSMSRLIGSMENGWQNPEWHYDSLLAHLFLENLKVYGLLLRH